MILNYSTLSVKIPQSLWALCF